MDYFLTNVEEATTGIMFKLAASYFLIRQKFYSELSTLQV
jgi:hypothetical protein